MTEIKSSMGTIRINTLPPGEKFGFANHCIQSDTISKRERIGNPNIFVSPDLGRLGPSDRWWYDFPQAEPTFLLEFKFEHLPHGGHPHEPARSEIGLDVRATAGFMVEIPTAFRELNEMLKKQKKLILTEEHQDAMRRAGRVNAQLMDFLRPQVKAGVTTGHIDDLVRGWTLDHGHQPATLGYQNYPKSCCTSVNDVICHGIPDDYELKEGDIVNVDVTTIVDGWHGDQSETFLIGEVSEERRAVTQCAFDCLYLAIDALKPGCRVSTIGETVVPEAHRRGFTVVREYVGHGLGRQFHLDPSIPHFPNRQSRIDRLYSGMCFTVEPMINGGSRYTRSDKSDGWTVRTKDERPSAQFEHSILMTDDGPEILTRTQNGPQKGHRF